MFHDEQTHEARIDPVITRRDVFNTIWTLALSTVFAGLADGESDDESDATDLHQVETRDSSPHWTARSLSTEDNDSYRVIRQSELEYFGATYDPEGDPAEGPYSDTGAWKHTFALTTQVLGVRPWYGDRDDSKEGDYFARPEEFVYGPVINSSGDVRKRHYDVSEFDFISVFENEFDVSNREDTTNSEDVINLRHDPAVGVSPEVEVSSIYPEDDIAIAVRRDQNLYSFSDPQAFISSFQTASGLNLFQSLAKIETPTDISRRRVSQAPFDRVETLKRQRDRVADNASTIGFALSVGTTALGVLGTLVGVSVFGLVFSALSVIILALIRSDPNADRKAVEYFEGFANGHPVSSNPAASTTVMFDLYASPEDSPIATVRARNGDEEDDKDIWFVQLPPNPDDEELDPSKAADAKLITPNSQGWPDEANEEFPNSNDHRIKLDKDDDRYNIVNEVPEASFSVEWEEKTTFESHLSNTLGIPEDDEIFEIDDDPSVDERRSVIRDAEREMMDQFRSAMADHDDQRPQIRDEPVRVTFDASGTQLGGAPINAYRWDLFRLGTGQDRRLRDIEGELSEPVLNGVAEAVSEPSNKPIDGVTYVTQKLSPGEPDSERLFEGPDTTTFEWTFTRPGEYLVALTVSDEHGKRSQQVARLTIEKPGDLSVSLDTVGGSQKAVDETFEFVASATSTVDRGDLPIPSGIPLPGAEDPAREESRFKYDWSIMRASSLIGNLQPEFRSLTDRASPRYVAPKNNPTEMGLLLESPGEYKVSVRVTDVLTGQRATDTITVVVESPQRSTLLEDASSDGGNTARGDRQ